MPQFYKGEWIILAGWYEISFEVLCKMSFQNDNVTTLHLDPEQVQDSGLLTIYHKSLGLLKILHIPTIGLPLIVSTVGTEHSSTLEWRQSFLIVAVLSLL